MLALGSITSLIIIYSGWTARQVTRDIEEVRQQIFPENTMAIEIRGLAGQAIAIFNAAKAAGSDSELGKATPIHDQVLRLLDELKKLNAQSADDTAVIVTLADAYSQSREAGLRMVEASVNQEYAEEAEWARTFDAENKKLLTILADIVAQSSAKHEEAMNGVLSGSAALVRMLLTSFVVLTIVGMLVLYMISRMSARLKSIADESASAASSLLEAMGHIAAMSSQLADKTSSSAAALDEVSSTFEVVNRQVRENADLARDAEASSREVLQTSNRSGESVKKVVESMQAMTGAGKEISSLVKVIENIAFQTNILALNAAVEAARAGDAGAGFAVVAGEVRNLASRTAEASKQVTEQIARLEETIGQGSLLVNDLEAAFPQVDKASHSVSGQMAKIIETSDLQSESQQQMGTALQSISSTVESLAAMSEESSGTVQEVRDQVERLDRQVEGLLIFWEGARQGRQKGHSPPPAAGNSPDRALFLPDRQ